MKANKIKVTALKCLKYFSISIMIRFLRTLEGKKPTLDKETKDPLYMMHADYGDAGFSKR